jgi:hypothetical protein
MIQSFQPYVDSQTKFDFGHNARQLLRLKQVLCTQEIILEILYTILNAMPISEIFEEKYMCSKRIKLDFGMF